MYRTLGKRSLDLLLSGLGLLFLSPLMILIALAIRFEDRGPALFHQERIGRLGKPFTLFKFRSMPVNTGNLPSAEVGEVEITRVGGLIRRTNLDEVPQLINIFRGEMSIVGPRPALQDQEVLCIMREELGTIRCLPGLTGLAQINSYDGMPDMEKATWDALYCSHVSFAGDIKIIMRTFNYLRKPPPVY